MSEIEYKHVVFCAFVNTWMDIVYYWLTGKLSLLLCQFKSSILLGPFVEEGYVVIVEFGHKSIQVHYFIAKLKF